ncbi:STT3 domain-containing protein [Halolamina rubra]|uniref:STT3 domain-containing protein n=1 Tax=Halolamina rubra TaxID=1380430 RepID=UPI0006789EC4|nr:STT3 domain-containing protein [Halolamina rubra]
MSDVREATATLRSDRPAVDDDLRAVLEVDASKETWTFDDIPIDSGTFGELVSRGIVEKVDGEYRVADREAVQAALDGEELEATAEDSSPSLEFDLDLPPRRVGGAIVAALAFVVAVRLVAYPSVFRSEHIVFLGNDPYAYRYLLLESLEQGAGVTSLPDSVLLGEPLMLAALLAVTKLLGGTVETADLVLAWYPVVAGLVTAALVYVLAVQVTDDRRVGVASVVMLAVTPVHAYRTAIGFADHHAFDYVWLAITAVAAVALLQRTSMGEEDDRKVVTLWTLALGGVVAVGVAGQVLAWNAGPLLLLPIALYGVVRATAAVDTGTSPLADLPLVGAIGLGGVLAVVVHTTLDWQELYIVATPLLLAAGLGAVLLVGEGARRYGLSARMTMGLVAAAGAVVFVVAYTVVPEFGAEFTQELDRLVGGGSVEGIAETASLFGTQYGTIVGPFFFFGLTLFFALPYMAWSLAAGWSQNRPVWQLAGSYSTVFLLLALLQVRFAGQLALFSSVFAGVAVVHLSAVTGATVRPAMVAEDGLDTWSERAPRLPAFSMPNRDTVLAVGMIVLLVGGLGAVISPARTTSLMVSDESYEAATFMDDHATEESWEYPQNYVFSEWGDSRMYNAIVNGESRSYGYAQSNYGDFLTSANASTWYQRLNGRTGFVVVDRHNGLSSTDDELMYNRLHAWGNETGHYRAVWASDDGSMKVFTLVPGATVTGSADPNATVTATTTVEVGGEEVTYSRTVTADASGNYSVRVPYPGTYEIADGSVTVSEEAVENGRPVRPSAESGTGS